MCVHVYICKYVRVCPCVFMCAFLRVYVYVSVPACMYFVIKCFSVCVRARVCKQRKSPP